MIYSNIFPQQSFVGDEVRLIACNSRNFTLFEIPNGIDLVFGKIIVSGDFILAKSASLDIKFLSDRKWHVVVGEGKMYVNHISITRIEYTQNILTRSFNAVSNYFIGN